MASIISAGTTSGTALNLTGDTSGILQFNTNNGTTAVSIGTDQNSTFSGRVQASGSPSNPTDTTVSFYNGSGVGPTISGYQFAVRTGSTPAERMRIDVNGNVSINTTSYGGRLTVYQPYSFGGLNAGFALIGATGESSAFSSNIGGGHFISSGAYYYGASNWQLDSNSTTFSGFALAAGTSTWYSGSGTAGTVVAGVQRMQLDASGNLLIATTTPLLANHKISVASYVASYGYATRSGVAGSYSGNEFNINWTGNPFLWIDSTNIGQIATTSDYRLKENVAEQSGSALERVAQLKPVQFTRKEEGIFNGSSDVEEGFIAHELQAVIPSAVHGEKDAVTEEGGIQPQSLNWAPIVSVLTKAIQELKSELDATKAEVAALKGTK